VPPLPTGKVPVVKADADVAYTAPPEVNVLKFVPPLAVGKTPVTPVVRGSPVALVNVAEATVPRALALPEASKLIDFPAGYVTNTVTAPTNVTALPELLEAKMVVRVYVGPVVE
jgi:hypothetical protein